MNLSKLAATGVWHFTDGMSAILIGQRQSYVEVFSDGFESGDLSAW